MNFTQKQDSLASGIAKFVGVSAIALSCFGLAVLLFDVFSKGLPGLDLNFLSSFPSRFAEKAGVKSALIGSLWLIAFTALFSIPMGVLSAIYLEEFAPQNWFTKLIKLNIANLAGVPSIVYGLLGLALFVRWMSLGQSVVSGALTLALLILPVIIISATEALKAVPFAMREAAYGVGATRRQAVFSHVLPEALAGIITGVILAISRAAGETAPLIAVGALAYAAFVPENAMDQFTALSIQIFNWASRPQAEFHDLAATAIIVLLSITLGLNLIAIVLRLKIAKGKEV